MSAICRAEATRDRLRAHAPDARVIYPADVRHVVPGQTGGIPDVLRGAV